MSGALYLPGADRTSRWFLDDYPGQFTFSHVEKTLLHSTETPKTGACPGYSGGGTAPQVTLNPWAGYRKIYHHFPLNRAGRALGNPDSTPVSENKDFVVQIEIIGYSDPELGRKYGCYLPDLTDADLNWLADQIAFIHKEWPHPTTLPSTWPLYKVSSSNAMLAAHMTSAAYDGFKGILAHLHAPKPSTHGDVALNIKALKAKIDARLAPPAEEKPPVTTPIAPVYKGTAGGKESTQSAMASEVYAAPNRSTTNPWWSGVSWYKYVGYYTRDTFQAVTKLATEVDKLTRKVDAQSALIQQLVDKFITPEEPPA